MTVVNEGRSSLLKILSEYDTADIYNLDETVLFFRLGPNYTLATSNVKGVKNSKDRNFYHPHSQRHWQPQAQNTGDYESEQTAMFWENVQPRDLCDLPSQQKGMDDCWAFCWLAEGLWQGDVTGK